MEEAAACGSGRDRRRPGHCHPREPRTRPISLRQSAYSSRPRRERPSSWPQTRRAADAGEWHRRSTRASLPSHDGLEPRRRIAPNLLDRELDVSVLNMAWVTDATYIWTMKGSLSLCASLDRCSRCVLGSAMGETNDRRLAIEALCTGPLRAPPRARPGPSLGPAQHVRQRGLRGRSRGGRHGRQHEREGRLLGQRGRGELLRAAERASWSTKRGAPRGRRPPLRSPIAPTTSTTRSGGTPPLGR